MNDCLLRDWGGAVGLIRRDCILKREKSASLGYLNYVFVTCIDTMTYISDRSGSTMID